MKGTFALSIEQLATGIYATSAMYRVMNGKRVTPAVLHRDHYGMLERGIRSAMGRVCMALKPWVTDCALDGEDDADLLTVELQLPEGFPSAQLDAVRMAIEDSVSGTVLADAYLNYDSEVAEANAEASRAAIGRLRGVLDRYEGW